MSLNDFIWYFLLFILKFIKKIIELWFQKINKGQLLIAEPSISGDLSFNRSVILLAITMKKDQ
jgi:hypothetical protein